MTSATPVVPVGHRPWGGPAAVIALLVIVALMVVPRVVDTDRGGGGSGSGPSSQTGELTGG